MMGRILKKNLSLLCLLIYLGCICYVQLPICHATEEYIETGILQEDVSIIDPYYDISTQYENTVAPMPCIAVMILSYNRLLPIKPIKTKKGIHPFSRYVTETYLIEVNKEFVNGSLGAYSVQDPLLKDYLVQHGIEIVEETNASSEQEIIWFLRRNLLNKNLCLVSFSQKSPMLILNIRDYPNTILLTVYDSSKGAIETVETSFLRNTSCTVVAYQYSSEITTSFWEEISDLCKKRFKHYLNSIVWDIELWFYKELDQFLTKMKELNPFSSS